MTLAELGIRWQLGFATDATARLYVSADAESGITQMHGQLRGPACTCARTLPASYAVRQLPATADQPCVAEVVLPDPCYWTPPLPFLYTLELEITAAGQTIQPLRTHIGLRRWVTQEKHLFLEKRRYVLRGNYTSQQTSAAIAAAREAELALWVAHPSAEFCHEASRQGVPLLVDLRGTESDLADYNDAAAVLVVLVSAALRPAPDFAQQPRNFLLATNPPAAGPPAPGSGELWALEVPAAPPAWLATADQPVLALRAQTPSGLGKFSRAACDRLQQALAPACDLAGYFVTAEDLP